MRKLFTDEPCYLSCEDCGRKKIELARQKKRETCTSKILASLHTKREVNYLKKVSLVVDFVCSNLRPEWILKKTIAHDRQKSRETLQVKYSASLHT